LIASYRNKSDNIQTLSFFNGDAAAWKHTKSYTFDAGVLGGDHGLFAFSWTTPTFHKLNKDGSITFITYSTTAGDITEEKLYRVTGLDNTFTMQFLRTRDQPSSETPPLMPWIAIAAKKAGSLYIFH